MVGAAFLTGKFLGFGSWEAWWISNLLHFLGGAYAFFFTRAVFLYTKPRHQISARASIEILFFIAGALILGVFWEWFEFALDRYRVLAAGELSLMTYPDTIGDLILDTLGAVIAGIGSRLRRWRIDV